ncbi:odorant receptor 49a-like [Lycorma delicatula]|uniref:odorant receptor 49a-like n=1 Tax=Lycorma delicatula TaxID=130591 RepID=UPI003F514384
MCLYTLVQENDLFLIIKYGIQISFYTIILYFYALNGQNLINEDNNVRRAINEFNWVDKPLWLKKYLLTVMTGMNKNIEVKPFGIYVINLKNFAKVMNAAYSYYSIFSKMSNKNYS